jgi:arylsulfatase A-like enzyme
VRRSLDETGGPPPIMAATAMSWLSVLVLGLVLAGCRRSTPTPVGGDGAAGKVAVVAGRGPSTGVDPDGTEGSSPTPTAPVLDFVKSLARCEVLHRGVLLDLGSPSVAGLEGWRLSPTPGITNIEKEGATWARIATRKVEYRFSLDEPLPIFVSAKVRGVASRSATVNIDGKTIGRLSFARGQTRIVSTQVASATTSAGTHVLSLQFSGSLKGPDPLAEVDWIRIGSLDEDPSTYAPPTLRDVSQSVALSSVPHRTIGLRAPGAVRCPLGVPSGARLRVAVGLQGSGEGEAQIRVLRDADAPVVLRQVRVLGGDRAAWTDIDLSLDGYAGKLAIVELSAATATRGTRVLFGDPVVTREVPADAVIPKAKAVVVVVMTGVDPFRLPPWNAERPLPTFDVLSREGVVFAQHRAPTTVSAGVMATVLTGLAPRQHTVEDSYARLPERVPTLATMAHDAGVRAAFFTANPATFEPFGFARGWDKTESHSPVSPAFGTAPFDDFTAWAADMTKASGARFLGVLHTRGIHPPFDFTPAEAAQLGPKDYTGNLDPRRAGQTLAKLRSAKKGAPKLSEADQERLSQLMDASLAHTDRALSNVIDGLRKVGLWNDTLLIVTADTAGAFDPSELPFAENVPLSEGALHVPLYVRFPGAAHGGTRIETPTTHADITKTVLLSIGTDAPDGATGADLFRLASGTSVAVERPVVATLPTSYATRWGELRLLGKPGSVPTLCDGGEGPTCEHDVREAMPFAARALFRWTYDQEAVTIGGVKLVREPATIDPETAAAFGVWGR